MRRLSPTLALILAVVLGIAGGLTVTLVDDDHDGQTDRTEIRVAPRAPGGDLAEPAGGPAVEKPQDSELRDDTPPEVQPNTLNEGIGKTDDLGQKLRPRPIGGAQNYECRTDLSGHVWSSYSIRPTEGVFHYTVSPNVTGWGDVNGIVGYFKRTRIASADRVVDFEGHCTQMTPITTGKAWTQGAANNATCWAYEIIATGRETRAQWISSPLISRGVLASMARDDSARCGIPLRRVNPAGCVFPPGITDHNALECGNSHTDVAPNFPWDVVMRQITGPAPAPISSTARAQCRQLNQLRKDAKKAGGWKQLGAGRWALARRRASNLSRHRYICTAGRGTKPGSISRR